MHRYFVSYVWSKPGSHGFGNTSVEANWMITGIEDIQRLVSRMKEFHEMRREEEIVILYWCRFEEE